MYILEDRTNGTTVVNNAYTKYRLLNKLLKRQLYEIEREREREQERLGHVW